MLQTCHKFKGDWRLHTGWLWSEKLDGHRCFWDGGITRGMPKEEVPWANCVKDSPADRRMLSTGLWTRYGNIFHAPDWWLAELPPVMLDGELWAGYGYRQDLPIKGLAPSFRGVRYWVYDTVPWTTLMGMGSYRCTSYKVDPRPWTRELVNRCSSLKGCTGADGYHERYKWLFENCGATLAMQVLKHKVVDGLMETHLDAVIKAGGEGLVLKANRPYIIGRSHGCLKVKPYDDAEGTLVGWTPGEGRLTGLIGALIIRLADGRTLNLSGMTDDERRLGPDGTSTYFKIGDLITYAYRGLTRDGLPQEARYMRVRHDP